MCWKRSNGTELKKISPRGTPAEGLPSELLYLGPDENITPTDINWVRPRPAPRAPRPVHCALRTSPQPPCTWPLQQRVGARACNPKAGLQP